MSPKHGCKSIIEEKNNNNLEADDYLISLTVELSSLSGLETFQRTCLHDDKLGVSTRVKTKHPVFSVLGEARALCGLIAAAQKCPLGQVPLDTHGEPSRISSVAAGH